MKRTFSLLMNRAAAAVAVGMFGSALSGMALPVDFNLRDTTATATAAIESGTITRSGITATLAAIVAGNSGVLNQTSSSFGIDAAAFGGSPHDASAQLDGVDGAESIVVSFDVDVLWLGLGLSSYGTGEQAELKIASFPAVSLAPTSASSDIYTFNASNLVPAGSTVILQWVSGAGFSFDSFTVEKWTRPQTGVPDAGSSSLLLVLAVAGLSMMVRRASPSGRRCGGDE